MKVWIAPAKRPAQRPAAKLQRTLVVGEAGDYFEHQADVAAEHVMGSAPASAAVDAVVAEPRVQRQWSDAPLGPLGGARSALVPAPSFGWNRDEVAVGGMRRIPVEGLTLGNVHPDKDPAAEEAADQRAVVIIPAALDLTAPVEVLLHFHGHNVGSRQRKTQGLDPTLKPGTVRDVDTDRIEQQLESSRRPIIGVLAQGTTSSDFGKIDSDAYIAEVFKRLTAMGVWKAPPSITRVVLSGHSGGGLPISEMMSEKGQPRFPSALGEVALFDAINGPNELASVRTWVISQLDGDLSSLTASGMTATAQLRFLSTSMRFRAYYTNSSYAARHVSLQQSIDGWFARHKAGLGGVGSPTYNALYANYHVFAVGHAVHEVIMSRDDKLLDALSALPAPASTVGTGTSAAPTTMPPGMGPPTIQRLPENDAAVEPDAPAIVHEALRSPGQPLDRATRAFFESRFNHDFGSVRVHADRTAAESARAVRAHAFTVGSDLVFGAGMYAPESPRGRKLIAHELAHVLQQGATYQGRARVARVAWTPTRADERTAAGTDRFAAQTFEVTISSVAGLSGVITTESIGVSVFVPAAANVPGRNKVHVFFGPGNATETGLPATDVGMNAVMTHGLRGASNATEWILIGVPGRSGPRGEQEGFFTIDTAAIKACLTAAGRASTTIDALRYSAHSRGYRGLRETLNRHLVSGPAPERVVILDAAYGSVQAALGGAGIPGSKQVAYNVTAGTSLKAPGAKNISIGEGAARAVGYTRIIRDAMTATPAVVVPPAIASQLLTLPPRGSFTTHSPPAPGATNINDFATANSAAIAAIVRNESGPDGLKTFIETNNLLKLGTTFGAGVYSHHLFVAEIAQELVD
jgi:hypothetical protein